MQQVYYFHRLTCIRLIGHFLCIQDPDVSKRDIFDVLVQWRDSVTENIKGLQFTEQQDVDEIIGKWQLETRLKGRQLTIPKGLFSIIIALV